MAKMASAGLVTMFVAHHTALTVNNYWVTERQAHHVWVFPEYITYDLLGLALEM